MLMVPGILNVKECEEMKPQQKIMCINLYYILHVKVISTLNGNIMRDMRLVIICGRWNIIPPNIRVIIPRISEYTILHSRRNFAL